MSSLVFNDVTSILNHGLASQQKIADLNRVASEIIRNREFNALLQMFDDLLFVAGELDDRSISEKENRIEQIRETFEQARIELLKEAKLLQALRGANDVYITQIDREIADARETEKHPSFAEAMDAHSMANVLKKRIYELSTTKAVAVSFSKQLQLSEDGYVAMADRILSVLTQLIPLLRGQFTAETSKRTFAEVKKILREQTKEVEKLGMKKDE